MKGFLKQNWIRWVVVLPGALLAGFLATFPLHWILYLVFAHNGTLFGFIELPPRADIPIEYFMYPFVIAIVFVFTGYRIAPAHKLKVASILFVVYFISWIIASIIALEGSIKGVSFIFSGRTIFALVGAGLGWYLAKKDSNKERLTP